MLVVLGRAGVAGLPVSVYVYEPVVEALIEAGRPLTLGELGAVTGSSRARVSVVVRQGQATGHLIAGKQPRAGMSGRSLKVVALPEQANMLPAIIRPFDDRVDIERAARRPTHAERARRMLSAYRDDDLSLEQIGTHHGVTAERVRQILEASDPTVYHLVQRRRAGRTRLRAFVEHGWVGALVDCGTCGESFTANRANSSYCSPLHQQVAMMFRYQTNEDYRTASIEAKARWTLSQDVHEWQHRHAERVLAGEVGTEGTNHRLGTRYLVRGTTTFHWGLRAMSLGWPLFERFHPDVQAQLKDHVA